MPTRLERTEFPESAIGDLIEEDAGFLKKHSEAVDWKEAAKEECPGLVLQKPN